MTERDRLKLLRLLSRSQTPLWLTETNQKQHNDLDRAADWLASLGYSAKNGFAVHYRELEEDEMYEPTLVSLPFSIYTTILLSYRQTHTKRSASAKSLYRTYITFLIVRRA